MFSNIESVFTVSIRAPARGATNAWRASSKTVAVSIRAPARGATSAGTADSARGHGFNSRSREGSDVLRLPIIARRFRFNSRSREGSDVNGVSQCWISKVSIRAPARGATSISTTAASAASVSIRAPARGATQCWKLSTRIPKFQFALPRGERPASELRSPGWGRFNSRSREGSDAFSPPPLITSSRFNSRSREGSDACSSAVLLGGNVSIRAPARGATPIQLHLL